MKPLEVANQYFDTEQTGRRTYDDILNSPELYTVRNITSEIKMLTPSKAIEAMAAGQGKTVRGALTRRKKMGSDEKVQHLVELLKLGVKLHMPILDYAQGGFIQDGYHRCMAAIKLGIPEIPVLVVNRK